MFNRNPNPALLHEDVYAMKCMAVKLAPGRFRDGVDLGIGVALLGRSGIVKAYNFGTVWPASVDYAVERALGLIGPRPKPVYGDPRHRSALPYALTAAHDVLPEHMLLEKLEKTKPTLRYEDLSSEACSPLPRGVRPGEIFTEIVQPLAQIIGKTVLDESYLVD